MRQLMKIKFEKEHSKSIQTKTWQNEEEEV